MDTDEQPADRQRMGRKIGALLAVIAAAATAACSSGDAEPPAPNSARTAATSPTTPSTGMDITLSPSDVAGLASAVAAAPTCASLLHSVNWASAVEADGCKEGDTVEIVASFKCTDGSRLYSFGERPYYWGNSADPLRSVASKSALDKSASYNAAYQKCIGGS